MIRDHMIVGPSRSRNRTMRGGSGRRAFVCGAASAAFAALLGAPAGFAQDRRDGPPDSGPANGPYGLRFDDEKHAAWARTRYEALTTLLERSHKQKSAQEKERYRNMHDHEIATMQAELGKMLAAGGLGSDKARLEALVEDLKQSWGRGVLGFDDRFYLVEMPWLGELYHERFADIARLADEEKLGPLTDFIEKVKEDLALAEREPGRRPPVYDEFRKAIRVIADAKRQSVREPLREILRDLEAKKQEIESRTSGVSEPKDD
jgi:hypothetical protein